MNAAEVKNALYARHPGHAGQMPGAWTCVEEWRGIDFLAFSAWSSQSSYGRIGYEVKISRSDLRAELLNPNKRTDNVMWCNEFYLAVPRGLLTPDEIAYEEPAWNDKAFLRESCPNKKYRQRPCQETVPVPTLTSYPSQYGGGFEQITCRVCGGKGYTAKSQVEKEAPTCWVPADLGLIVVDGRGTKLVRKSPRRKEVPMLRPREVGQLVRWISIRPDPRHHPQKVAQAEVAA